MNARQIALVRRSFARIAPHADRLGEVFYAALFRLDPPSRALFAADLAPQIAKLTAMLASIVDGLDEPQRLDAMFRALGRRHAGYGVNEDQYDHVGAALLIALRGALGEEFDPDVEDAWAAVYAEIAESMISAAHGLADD